MISLGGNGRTDHFTIAGQVLALTAPSASGQTRCGMSGGADLAAFRTGDDHAMEAENGKPFELRLGTRTDSSLHTVSIGFGCGVTKVTVGGTELSAADKDSAEVALSQYPSAGVAKLVRKGCRPVLEISGSFGTQGPAVPVVVVVAPSEPPGSACPGGGGLSEPPANPRPAPAATSSQPAAPGQRMSFSSARRRRRPFPRPHRMEGRRGGFRR